MNEEKNDFMDVRQQRFNSDVIADDDHGDFSHFHQREVWLDKSNQWFPHNSLLGGNSSSPSTLSSHLLNDNLLYPKAASPSLLSSSALSIVAQPPMPTTKTPTSKISLSTIIWNNTIADIIDGIMFSNDDVVGGLNINGNITTATSHQTFIQAGANDYSALTSQSLSSSNLATETISAMATNSTMTTVATTTTTGAVGSGGVGDIGSVGAGADGVSSSSSFETMRLIKIGLLALMFILIFCGNTFVLVALNNRKLRKNRMYFFLVHLSIADLVTGFFNVLPQLGWEVARRLYGGNVLCKMVKFLQILGPYLSSYVLVMTAIDRYQAICHPLSNSLAHTRRSRWMVAIAWIISLLYCTPQSIIFSYQKVSDFSDDYECWGTFPEPWMPKMYVTWYAISVFIVPFLILTWTHYYICREIWINWHSKRQSLLIKPEQINSPKVPDQTKKSHSLSSSFGSGVNQIIHRLSNSGLDSKDHDEIQRSKWRTSKQAIIMARDHHHHHHHHHYHQLKYACRRIFWFYRKSSSSSSTSSSESYTCSSSSLPSPSIINNMIQKCPIHHHQFRHHYSRNNKNHPYTIANRSQLTKTLLTTEVADEFDPEQANNNCKNNVNDINIGSLNLNGGTIPLIKEQNVNILRHTKSESELLFKKQEKELKRRGISMGMTFSSESVSDVNEENYNDNINGEKRQLRRQNVKRRCNSINFIMGITDGTIYKTSKNFEKEIQKWMTIKQQQQQLHNQDNESNSNPGSRMFVTNKQVHNVKHANLKATFSISNCICCPQCCPYCPCTSSSLNHQFDQNRLSENINKDSPHSNGSISAIQKKQQQIFGSRRTNSNDEKSSGKPSSITSIIDKSSRAIMMVPSQTSTIQSTNVSTPTGGIVASTANTDATDSTNVVNVFVPRNYHINAGNKRMSNPRIHSMHGLTRAKIKTVKITLVVITCYVLCSTPFIFVQLWAQFWPNAQESPIYTGPVIAILMLLPSLNSCVNPWIYIYFNPNLITLFCQFFKRKSSSEDPLPKSDGGGGTIPNNIYGHAKLHKKFTTDSPECSLSLTETCRTPRRSELIDMKPSSGYHYAATNRLNIPTNHTESDLISDKSISINKLAQYCENTTDNGDKLFHLKNSDNESIEYEPKITSNNQSITSKNSSKQKRNNSISIQLDKMLMKLSLKKDHQTQQQQHRQILNPKSSQLRLYKASNVECVVNNDKFIV